MIRSTCFTITTIRTIKIIIGFQGLGLRARGSEFRVRSCLVVGSGTLWRALALAEEALSEVARA